jgi:hypothetical protein
MRQGYILGNFVHCIYNCAQRFTLFTFCAVTFREEEEVQVLYIFLAL